MKKFNAKLLLFGEYGLMFGAEALAVPFPHFTGELAFASQKKVAEVKQSQRDLEHFVTFFEQEGLNEQMNFPIGLDEIRRDLKRGLHFDSDIPLQYGVGSSGALCAALYQHYGSNQLDLKELKEKSWLLSSLKHDFSVMESFFHGKSSGFDPLVSYVNRPVLLVGDEIRLPSPEIQTPGYSVVLLNTQEKSPTAPLVSWFVKNMEAQEFKAKFDELFLPSNSQAIHAFLNGDTTRLFQALKSISAFQRENLQPMIPEAFKSVFQELTSRDIPIKLLGSGGGGYLLAFVPDGVTLPAKLKSLKVF
ncbi:mevalonate kinase family protein [Sunxiuqinia rutila]|uniref:mevalonate kinase family protein n=1 Tax=Sunxiuqinia rutila TaxID=1397841 RepID=UPI003D367581